MCSAMVCASSTGCCRCATMVDDGQITIVSKRNFLPQSHTAQQCRSGSFRRRQCRAVSARSCVLSAGLVRACRGERARAGSPSLMNGLRKHARSLALVAGRTKQHIQPPSACRFTTATAIACRKLLHIRLKQELAEGNTLLRRGQFLRRTPTGLTRLKPARPGKCGAGLCRRG